MPDPTDPFGLNARDPERDPANGPPVPNMGGIPQIPMDPAANMNPFGVTPVAADQGGRPSEGASATPGAAATPEPTPAPAAAEPPKEEPKPPSGVTINVGSASGGEKPTVPGQPGAPSAPQPTVPGLPAPVKMDRLPTAPEMDFAPPGSTFETPLGTITKDAATGRPTMQFNEAGILKYKEAKTRAITQFGGYPLAGMAGVPMPPVEPGQPAYNPFLGTGGWIGTVD